MKNVCDGDALTARPPAVCTNATRVASRMRLVRDVSIVPIRWVATGVFPPCDQTWGCRVPVPTPCDPGDEKREAGRQVLFFPKDCVGGGMIVAPPA